MSGMHKGRLVLQAKADGKRHVTLPDGRTVETRPEQNTKEVQHTQGHTQRPSITHRSRTPKRCGTLATQDRHTTTETQYDRAHPPHAAQEQNSKEVCVLLQKEGHGARTRPHAVTQCTTSHEGRAPSFGALLTAVPPRVWRRRGSAGGSVP